eukprot:6225724-Amphidinium_carterae.1
MHTTEPSMRNVSTVRTDFHRGARQGSKRVSNLRMGFHVCAVLVLAAVCTHCSNRAFATRYASLATPFARSAGMWCREFEAYIPDEGPCSFQPYIVDIDSALPLSGVSMVVDVVEDSDGLVDLNVERVLGKWPAASGIAEPRLQKLVLHKEKSAKRRRVHLRGLSLAQGGPG